MREDAGKYKEENEKTRDITHWKGAELSGPKSTKSKQEEGKQLPSLHEALSRLLQDKCHQNSIARTVPKTHDKVYHFLHTTTEWQDPQASA